MRRRARNVDRAAIILLTVLCTSAVTPLAAQEARSADSWELLGSSRVSFAAVGDAIDIGSREGLFDAIRIDVDGDVEMYDVRVIFGNGVDWSPGAPLSFNQGSRSRAIDLPGEARVIRRVEWRYRSRFRVARATVQVFGRRARPAVRDEGGWEQIGMREVDFRVNHDVIPAAGQGRFQSIRIAVEGGDLEMYSVRIVFGDGQIFSPRTRLSFRGGSSSRVIDLPGRGRVIRRIDFYYRSMGRGRRGRATVRVFGRR